MFIRPFASASAFVLSLGILSLGVETVAQERGPAGTVTLPRADYDRLIDLSARASAVVVPPVASTLARSDMRVRISNTMARGSITIDGEVFRTGPVKVPLIAGATLLEARMGNLPLPLHTENNTLAAVITGPRAFSISLEWASPLTLSPGRGSVTLPVPAAGSAVATIQVPGERSDVRVSPGVVLRRESAGGMSVLEVSLTPGTPAQISWAARDTGAGLAPRDVRILSDVKTLVTIGDAEVRLRSLVDLTFVQGEQAEIEVRTPAGYEILGVSGATLDRSEEIAGGVRLFLTSPGQRRHQFLMTLHRSESGASFKLDTGFPTVPAAQREAGEVAVEGTGTLEISATEVPGLRRIDVRELDRQFAATAGDSILAGYRYQRSLTTAPALALSVTRFPDASVLAAVAERAIATTLISSEGRALTEVSLWIRNRAQPFVKVALPQGASMVSVEVAGEPAKPVEGADGTRVPLLRPGFRPQGPYGVTFVYIHEGTPFAKKGDMQMVLPRMDLPVTMVHWEVFVPDKFRADRFAGNVIAADVAATYYAAEANLTDHELTTVRTGIGYSQPGSIAGVVSDTSGGVIAGAKVTVTGAGGQTITATTDSNGRYVLSSLPSGSLMLTGEVPGFKTVQRAVTFSQQPQQVDFRLPVGALNEALTVSVHAGLMTRDGVERRAQQTPPSANVQSLQRRAAGVLPVRIEVPRAGSSHRFVKPLLIDEETVVKFRYRTK